MARLLEQFLFSLKAKGPGKIVWAFVGRDLQQSQGVDGPNA